MSLLEMGGKRYTIPAGEVTLGSDSGSAVPLSGSGILPKHAVLKGLPDGQVVIRKAVPEAEVTINGVRLGAEPAPLLHGDKVQVGAYELTFVDERRSGSTQYVAAVDLSKMGPGGGGGAAKATGPAKPTGTTGGRVVCLTDGREYAVVGASLVFGREAGCDVVVPGKDVSRRHAEIHGSPKGYFVVDLSTNGTFVNEQRVEGQRLLSRGDVVRIGEENFRFYADAAATPPPAGPQTGGGTGAAANAPSPPPSPAPTPSAPKLQNTSFGMPAAPRPSASEPPPRRTAGTPAPSTPQALGNFLVRTGALKGQRLTLKTPIVNIGRAEYNDLVFPDESVSTTHAKLQRREGVWVLVDLESTNGTFVDGEKISADTPLAPGALVRFGDVQLVFEPTDDALGVAKGGGTKVMSAFKTAEPAAPAPKPAPPSPPAGAAAVKATVPSQRPVSPKPPAPAPAPAAPRRPAPSAPAQTPEKKGKGCGASAAVIVVSAAALAYWFLA